MPKVEFVTAAKSSFDLETASFRQCFGLASNEGETMRTRVVVLGAGFGGLELTTMLSDAFGDAIDIVLVDKGDAFVFGFSKLDVMFGRQLPAAVRHRYSEIVKPGVRFVQTTVRSIDPEARRAVTGAGTFDADVLVVALGADYDLAATPGLVEGGSEFYTVDGAFALRDALPRFERGPAIVGVCGKSFKCPPAPSEAALLLHDYLTARGLRQATDISVVMPFGTPIPPSPDTSQAILAAFAERGITFVKDRLVKALDPARKVAVLSDGTEMLYAIFLGVPVHRVPHVVVESGLAAHPHDWVPVNKQTLETKFPGVYAIGDVNGVGTPKAGVFAEGSAQVVAAAIVSRLRGGPQPDAYKGQGSCYVEFGHGQVGRVDVDFLTGPKPTGTFRPPSAELVEEKTHFAVSRLQRWFGQQPAMPR
jgi:sulfide:quinone oxidoreductase